MVMTTDNIEIRLMNNEDLVENKNAIIELLKDNYQINFPEKEGLSVFAENNYRDLVKYNINNSAILVGAFCPNKFLGFIWAYRRVFLGEKRIHIGHIVVNFEYRGKSIGTKLINFIEKFAIKEKIFNIELMTTNENNETIHFYKNNGFNITRVQLEKKLGGKNDN